MSDEDVIGTTGNLARLLCVTLKTVAELAKDGIFERAARPLGS
jgi:hypothetical protein